MDRIKRQITRNTATPYFQVCGYHIHPLPQVQISTGDRTHASRDAIMLGPLLALGVFPSTLVKYGASSLLTEVYINFFEGKL